MTPENQTTEKLIELQWNSLPELTRTVIQGNKYHEVLQRALKKAEILDEEIHDSISLDLLLTLLELQTVTDFNSAVEQLQTLKPEQKKLIINEVYTNLFSTLALDNPELKKNASITQEVLAQREVAERLGKLPEKVRNFILSNTTHQYMQRAVASAGLSEEKAKLCIEQIIRGATGLATTQDFKTFASSKLSLEATQVSTLVDEVTQNIFNPIREVLLTSLENKSSTPTNGNQGSPAEKEGSSSTTDPYKEQVV